MIHGLVLNDSFQESIEIYHSMRKKGLSPDSFTFPFLLKACARLLDSKLGIKLHGLVVKAGCESDAFVNTSLVSLYGKCGFIDNAFKVFDDIPEKNVAAWTAIISGYTGVGKCREAIDMFRRLLDMGLRPDSFSLVRVLAACTRIGDLRSGEWIDDYITKIGMVRNVFVATSLVDFYVKCGNMERACSVFDGMLEKDIVSWSSMIQGYASNGLPKEALDLFFKMEKSGIEPDGNTFVGLLCACTHAGLVDEGRQYFNSMERVFTLTPEIEHYGCMVDLLCRAGFLDEAHQLVKSMPMEANAIVWGALLGGCRLHRDTQLVEGVLKQLIALEPSNSGNYVLLSNIYSASHKWDDAAKIRSIMSERGIKKVPGYSWIEVDGVVHEFLVGDTSHPLSEKIYAKLGELVKDLKAEGYVPTTDYVLFDIEEEEKEHFIGCHSEKLAIAFGLISTAPNDKIRVVKNLRVCGDCHEAIKHISRFTGREIIVRDNNRFHCFNDGSCSCKDYW
ncbi:pentatricopeptide repeat-containing protein [Populus alba x Populus x berolinensis]|uniref:Pentatricopeptide repeat-containing protein n=1 Tax=Populus alba x Populus x berolinensis TaxID=444605 RepID=A0AAD6QMB9_9ROSI|nr:pentatricopeptide repeat-containing protein [Populus alba x Populus x berolinensis]